MLKHIGNAISAGWKALSKSGRPSSPLRTKRRRASRQQAIQHMTEHLTSTFTGPGFRKHFMEGYKKNPLVFGSMAYYKKTIGQAEFVVKDSNDEIVDGHWASELLADPNEHMDQRNTMDFLIDHWFLSGNIYQGLVMNRSKNRPVEMWPLMPHKIEIALDEHEIIDHYRYKIGGTDQPIEKDRVIHLRYQDPSRHEVGMSPLRPAFRHVDIENEMTEFTKSMLENSAIPGIVLKFADESLVRDKEERERVEKKFKSKFGSSNRGDPALMGVNDEIETVGLNMQEMAIPELAKTDEGRIFTVMGVSPILMNTSFGMEGAKHKNFREARKQYWQDHAFSFGDRLTTGLTDQLLRPFESSGTGLYIDLDYSGVSAVQDMKQDEKKQVMAEWKSGLINLNEYRAKFNMPPVDGERGKMYFDEIKNQGGGSGNLLPTLDVTSSSNRQAGNGSSQGQQRSLPNTIDTNHKNASSKKKLR